VVVLEVPQQFHHVRVAQGRVERHLVHHAPGHIGATHVLLIDNLKGHITPGRPVAGTVDHPKASSTQDLWKPRATAVYQVIS
jgi:hypothetical protein